jgi:hypothetical protein
VLDSGNEIFGWQRDPEVLGTDVYTFFEGLPMSAKATFARGHESRARPYLLIRVVDANG